MKVNLWPVFWAIVFLVYVVDLHGWTLPRVVPCECAEVEP